MQHKRRCINEGNDKATPSNQKNDKVTNVYLGMLQNSENRNEKWMQNAVDNLNKKFRRRFLSRTHLTYLPHRHRPRMPALCT